MSVPDRRALLDRDHRVLSRRRQCQLLGLSRSGLYRAPVPDEYGRADTDAADRRVVHGLAVPRFAPNCPDAGGGWLPGQSQAGAAAAAPHGDCGARPQAAHQQAGARASDLPISAAQPGD
jgi:hypothetical protein